ncbi:hypothetical protein AWR36_012420 [Microbulbifer flavimaris]|uniref:Uncharacterized protein n=1 Tax=Microbulbifer flavimaris TaxID=1781068 RepID=A0ABX4HXG7_9GAMM|nr:MULTISPECIES: hypothetical protein [Microbulbifer]KUJ82584.1 hypothetical protein AVO43_12385 [Microbulbifer sp. ZGT114]PCO04794.1 hypothetical protein AWR36_012420 [Microbulbifer flavimaris]
MSGFKSEPYSSKASVLGGLMLLFALGPASAQERFVCKLGNSERIIEVVQVSPPAGLPCEVQYTKPSGTETLWRSQYQAGFCEARAREFAEKQAGWGWECARASDPQEDSSGPDTQG